MWTLLAIRQVTANTVIYVVFACALVISFDVGLITFTLPLRGAKEKCGFTVEAEHHLSFVFLDDNKVCCLSSAPISLCLLMGQIAKNSIQAIQAHTVYIRY
jgi:hypothetical protein